MFRKSMPVATVILHPSKMTSECIEAEQLQPLCASNQPAALQQFKLPKSFCEGYKKSNGKIYQNLHMETGNNLQSRTFTFTFIFRGTFWAGNLEHAKVMYLNPYTNPLLLFNSLAARFKPASF